MTPSEKGRALAALRPRQLARCVVCGHEWSALVRPKQPPKTCSNACRQQRYRDRRKAHQTATSATPGASESAPEPRQSQ